MFNLFRKKPKANTEEIIVVTGANGFGGSKFKGESTWKYSCPVIAWKKPGHEINVEETRLFVEGQQEEIKKIINGISSDQVFKVAVIHENGKFTLVKALGKSSDTEMEEFLNKQLTPTHYTDEVLGKFLLNRSVNWFEKEIYWLGKKVRISFESDSEEKMKHSCNMLRSIIDDMDKWDKESRICASKDLLELKNDVWLDEDESILTPEDFQNRITLESIGIGSEEDIEFWFNDGDIFWGHSICVYAHIKNGCVSANMLG